MTSTATVASIFSSVLLYYVMSDVTCDAATGDDESVSITYGQIASHESAKSRFLQSQQLVHALRGLRILDNNNNNNRTVCYVLEHAQRGTNVTSSVGVVGDDVTHHVAEVTLRFIEIRLKRPPNNQLSSEQWCTRALYTQRTTTTRSTTTMTLTSVDLDPQAENTNNSSDVTNNKSATATEHRVERTQTSVDANYAVLNKRQVLVISTCSTVIGLFSIVALILRIRNYMKRTKQEKEGTRRHVRSLTSQDDTPQSPHRTTPHPTHTHKVIDLTVPTSLSVHCMTHNPGSITTITRHLKTSLQGKVVTMIADGHNSTHSLKHRQ